MQTEQRVVTGDVVREIFIEALTDQPLAWEADDEQKRWVGEFLALPIIQKLDELLAPVVEHIQREGILVDMRRTAQSAEQTVRVLEQIHEDISSSSKAHSLNEEEIVTIRKQYFATLYERSKMLDFRGIMHVDMNHSIRIPLTEVFVLPDVLVGMPEYETLEREGEDGLYGYSVQQKPRRVKPEREALHTALTKYRRLVLLGDPGSGKSTLLRYLLLQLVQGSDILMTDLPEMSDSASIVPLYVQLSVYADILLANAPGMRSLADFLPNYLRDNYLGEYMDFLLDQLQRGNLLLLFDGLDEIPDATLRMNVVRHIELFTQTYAANRFLVTSRIVGYKEAPLACDYQLYTLADFSEEQVRTFTQRWCPAYERWVKGTCDSQYLADAATKEADKLFSATQSRPAVKRLAVNPLLLTILALIQRQGIDLPSHRIELFDLCAMTLIDTWVRAKGHATNFNKNELIKILRPLAFWMHEHPAVGAIPEEELYDQVVQLLVKRTISEQEASKQAEQFLQTVRGKTGVLIERGKGRYGFLHLTFEEYFAAMELAKHKERNAFIKKHLHDPRWREVILLTVGVIGILQSDEEEVTELVYDVIAHADSPYEWALHRDLLFAGICLADDVGVTLACENEIIEQIVYFYLTSPYDDFRRTNVVAEWQGTRIAEKVAALVVPRTESLDEEKALLATSPFEKKLESHVKGLATEYQQVMTKRLHFNVTIALARLQALEGVQWQENILGLLSEESVREKVSSALKQCKPHSLTDVLLIALSDPDTDVKVHVLRALAYLGDSQPRVIDALLMALSDNGIIVKKEVADAFAQLGERQPCIINTLLTDVTDFKLYEEAAVDTLWCLAGRQPEVTAFLLKAVVDVEDQDVRVAASNVLELLDTVDGEISDVLLTIISHPNTESTAAFATMLSKISNDPETLFSTLYRALSDTTLAREVAILALGYVGKPHPLIIETLLAVASESDRTVRRVAIRSLGYLGKDQQRVIDALLSALSDTSWQVRREAVKALEQLDNRQFPILDVLLSALSDRDGAVREAAVLALGRLGGEEPHVVEALISPLSDTWSNVREAAVTVLGQCDRTRPLAIESLRVALAAASHNDLLLQDTAHYEEWNLRRMIGERILDVLKDLETTQPDIIEALFSVISNLDSSGGYKLAQVFGQLGKKEPHIIDRLLSLFSAAKQMTRIMIIDAIGFSGRDSPHIRKVLLSALTNANPRVRGAAAEALGRLAEGDPLVVDALILALSDREYMVRQQAARSLGQLHDKQPHIVDALLLALSDPSGIVRGSVARALGDIDDKQPRIIDALIQSLSDSSHWAVEGASYALGKLLKDQPLAFEALLSALHSSNVFVRIGAAQTLRQLGDTQASIIEALVDALSDANYFIRKAAAEALGWLVNGQPRAVQALLLCLSDSSSSVRAAAARALANTKVEELAAIDALLQTLSDSSWLVRMEAAFSLTTYTQEQEVIGPRLEDLLRQYEPTAQRRLGGYSRIFRALQNFAKKKASGRR
jgi:HEAT repeat protein/energy-coupling factor transporter ATP-binding protein EcfA2